MLLFRAFIATIPRELDEAAIMDGAGPVRLFFQIILPLLRPVVVTVIVVQSVAIFNDFTNPLYYLPGNENVTVQLTLYNFQSQFNTAVQSAVHEHPADHDPAADHVPVLQSADRGRDDRGRGQGIRAASPAGTALPTAVPPVCCSGFATSDGDPFFSALRRHLTAPIRTSIYHPHGW